MGNQSIFGDDRIVGPGMFTPAVAMVLMSFWVFRVIIWPDALIEAVVVFPLGILVVWRFIRVGVWVDDGHIVVRNAWDTQRAPMDEAKLVRGYVDDISDFDRFTGGHTNRIRAELGDDFAGRKFLRHRMLIDGEEHDIDAMFGRTPKSQMKAAERLEQLLQVVDHRPGDTD